jgi:hypothetical protein
MSKNRTARERDAVQAFVDLLLHKGQEWHFEHHPDEQTAPYGRRPKAPDYLYGGPRGQLVVEFTELATIPSEQAGRARFRQAVKAALSISWPPGEYTIQFLTSDDRKIRRVVESGELSALAAQVPTLEISPAERTESFLAFHRRDPSYYLSDANGLLVISKTSSDGHGQRVVTSDSASADGYIELFDPNSPTGILKVPTTSGTLRPLGDLENTLAAMLEEANEKFLYAPDAEAALVIDVMSYAGPVRVRDVLQGMPWNSWKQINHVWLVVDEPYCDPPPASGDVSGKFRFWQAH